MLHQVIRTNTLPLQAGSKPKVYSYARWSTEEQAKGHSQRRQVEAAERWTKARGLELDASLAFRDEGVSAFRGTNVTGGALGQFLEECKRQTVEPGSILLVESLDRISRMDPLMAQQVFSSIILSGVTIVTLSDNQEYSRERLQAEPFALMIAMMVSIRAHEESATKARRVAAAWSARREKMRAGQIERLTRRGPSWLVPAGNGWRIDEAKVATVQRVYRMTLAGEGEHKIAGVLNSERVPVLGRGMHWHRSTVAKLLRSRAVIGEAVPGHIEYVDGRRHRKLEQPVPNAFPAIISESDWLAVRALKDGRAVAARGRHAGHGVAHLLAGLTRCPECGSSMSRVMKGSGSKAGSAKLVCSRAKTKAGCRYVSVAISDVEQAFTSNWGALFENIPAGDAAAHLDYRYQALLASIDGTEDHLSDLTDAYQRAPSHSAARALQRVEAELRSLRADLEELDERRRMADRGLICARMGEFWDLINEDALDRTKLNAALKVLFTAVVVDYRTGRLRFQWRQGSEVQLVYAWVDC